MSTLATTVDQAVAEQPPVPAPDLAVLERRIAITAARCDIETFCAVAESHCRRGGPWTNWYDTALISGPDGIEAVAEERQTVADAVLYLDLLDLLEHHHFHRTWVRIKDIA